jgi:hypothetical protein
LPLQSAFVADTKSMEPWLATLSFALSAGVTTGIALWRRALARTEHRTTDVYLEWLLADAGPLAIRR